MRRLLWDLCERGANGEPQGRSGTGMHVGMVQNAPSAVRIRVILAQYLRIFVIGLGGLCT